MKISIIGSGVFAKAIAALITSNGHNVIMWTEEENPRKIVVPRKVKVTNDIKIATEDKDIIFMLIGSKYMKSTLSSMKPFYNKSLIVIGSKGLLDTGKTLYSLTKEILNTSNIGVISGPTFAIDVKNLEPVGFTYADKNKNNYKLLRELFQTSIKEYTINTEEIEICGAIKNVYAIGSGIIYGLNYGMSTRVLYLMKSIEEIKLILKSLNLTSKEVYSYAGIGDLFLTSSSPNSRNFTLGTVLAMGRKKEVNEFLYKNTVEGYENLLSFYKYLKEKSIDAPILTKIYQILIEDAKPKSLIEILH